jgi:hypothetical protein
LGREAPKCQNVDLERRAIEHDVFPFGGKDMMLAIAKRLPQLPDGEPQIIEKGVVMGITPQQRRQLSARLGEFRAEAEIGQQQALALPERYRAGPATERDKLEAAKQAKRPARRHRSPVLRS